MTESDITQLMIQNRQTLIGWFSLSLLLTLATFFLAYVIRGTPVYVRGALFAVFLLGSLSFFMIVDITNEGFLSLVRDLAASGPQSEFAKGTVATLGADAPALPAWARAGRPIFLLLNLLIGFHLLLVEKWER